MLDTTLSLENGLMMNVTYTQEVLYLPTILRYLYFFCYFIPSLCYILKANIVLLTSFHLFDSFSD